MNDSQSQRSPDRPAPPSRYPERWVPKVGDVISWRTFGGGSYRGRVFEMDSNVAYVLCDDGERRCVEC